MGSSPETYNVPFQDHYTFGSLYVCGKLPTYPSPKPTFTVLFRLNHIVQPRVGTHFLSSNTHLPVVIENGVHVFYPHRINRSIKHDPLAVLNDRTGVLAECVSKYS